MGGSRTSQFIYAKNGNPIEEDSILYLFAYERCASLRAIGNGSNNYRGML